MLTKSILNADLNRTREKMLFDKVLKEVKIPIRTFPRETCFSGYGTNWKGSLEERNMK